MPSVTFPTASSPYQAIVKNVRPIIAPGHAAVEGMSLMVWWIVAKKPEDGRRRPVAAVPADRVGPFASPDEAEAERRRLARERRQSAGDLRIVCDFS